LIDNLGNVRYGGIYKITNLINSKSYVGQTIKNLNTRKSQHKNVAKNDSKNNHLYSAINIYGWKNFSFELIAYADSEEDLDNKEKYWIKFYNLTDRLYGYNKSVGGRSHSMIDIDKCISLFKDGWTITDIAKKFKYDRSNLLYRLKSSIPVDEYNLYIEEINKKKKEKIFIRCFKKNIKIEDILPYIEKAISFKDIAKELGCSRSCIQNRLKEYYKDDYDSFSYKYRYRGRKHKSVKIQIDINKVIQLRKENKTFEEIAKQFNCSRDVISERLKQALNEYEYLKISDNKFKSKKFKITEENIDEQN
jgi:group I intron endonuclease